MHHFNIKNSGRLGHETQQWVFCIKMAPRVTGLQLHRTHLGGSGKGDSNHGCVANQSRWIMGCHNNNIDTFLTRLLLEHPRRNKINSKGKSRSNTVLDKYTILYMVYLSSTLCCVYIYKKTFGKIKYLFYFHDDGEFLFMSKMRNDYYITIIYSNWLPSKWIYQE